MADSQTPLLDKFNNRRNQKPTEVAEKILFGIIGDLTGRKGLDNEWDNLDDETKEELLQTNLRLIQKNIA
jgi:hypothetical protein